MAMCGADEDGPSGFAKSTKIPRSPQAPTPDNPQWLCLKFTSPTSSLAVRKALKPIIPLRLAEFPEKNEIRILLQPGEQVQRVAAAPPCQATVTLMASGSKGTIFCRELANWNLDEIREELGEIVSEITQFPTSSPTPGRYLLQFKTNPPPETVRLACGLLLSVRQLTPAPLRCRKCLVYGHHERYCKKKQCCTNCSREGHIAEDCIAEPFCRACKEPHPVTHPTCSTFIREREAARIRTRDGCSLNSARKKVLATRQPITAPTLPAPALPAPILPTSAPLVQRGSKSATAKELFPPLPSRAPTGALPTQPAQTGNAADQATQQQILQLMAQQMSLLATLVEQNKSIMQQNAQILRLLGDKLGEASPVMKEGKRRRKQSAPIAATPVPGSSCSQPSILSVLRPLRCQQDEESTTNDEGGKN